MSRTPKPGRPVRGSHSGVPVMALLDLLGRRWTMGVLWNLGKGGPCTFRELQERCEAISPTVLNSRLKELREVGLIEHSQEGYRATWPASTNNNDRVMVTICHNMDLGDCLEHADDPDHPEKFSAVGIRIAVNCITYAMTQ